MSVRHIKDAIKALQAPFSAATSPLSLPSETRRILQDFVTAREGKIDEQESATINAELKSFYERHVGKNNLQKTGLFAGVLRELRPILLSASALREWWTLALKPLLSSSGQDKAAVEDAKAFVVDVMVAVDENERPAEAAKTSNRICKELLLIYLARTQTPAEDKGHSASDNAQVAQQIEDVLIASGRKKPKQLFMAIDDLVISASSRLQALSLLNAFLRHQTPHLYLVLETSLFEHLLQSLMNDTSTTALSMALTSVIMVLPHIPGSLEPFLPRLFLIYSRLLCWERFSSLSTQAERNVVTDDRVANELDEEGRDPGNLGLDATWDALHPEEGAIEASTPELLVYFTSLYGLYPLNFMAYIRKARRYLKDADFPGAEAFDLDSEVIRRRSEQYQEAHLLHPNFFSSTIEHELHDAKWAKMDPAEVVGECHGLLINKHLSLRSPGPPPAGRLPDVPPVPLLSAVSKRSSGPDSPVLGNLRAASARADSASSPSSQSHETPAGEVRHLRPRRRSSATTLRSGPSIDDFASAPEASSEHERKSPLPQSDIAFLQQEVSRLRNDLNFEKWHKAQYSQHIGRITKKNVKNATVEAETLNLINANKALRRQLEQVQKAREATIKDSALTRKQANSLETHMTERFNKLRAEQETWRSDAEELKRLRAEMPEYRQRLVATEAQELSTSHELQLAKRDLERLDETQTQLQDAKRRLREYQYREFEFEHATREKEILENEKQLLEMKLQRYDDERERMRHHLAQTVGEVQSQHNGGNRSPSNQRSADSHALMDSQSRLLQLRKAHSRLLEKYTDLELDYQEARGQLESLQAQSTSGRETAFRVHDTVSRSTSHAAHRQERSDFGFEFVGDYNPAEASYALPSASEPSQRQYMPGPTMPASPPPSEATVHSSAGLTFRPSASRGDSVTSRSSGSAAGAFNASAPLGTDEAGSVNSRDSSGTGKGAKIQPDSQLRVYGRGGAQNIKLKQKSKEEGKGGSEGGSGSTKKSVMKSLRGLG